MFRFTSQEYDGMGKLRKTWYEITSQDWEIESSFISRVYAVMETAKIYLDNSIMPWLNNQSSLFVKY
jgi:hypothetical protein